MVGPQDELSRYTLRSTVRDGFSPLGESRGPRLQPAGYEAPDYGVSIGFSPQPRVGNCPSPTSLHHEASQRPGGFIEVPRMTAAQEPVGEPTSSSFSVLEVNRSSALGEVPQRSGAQLNEFASYSAIRDWHGVGKWSTTLCSACCHSPLYCMYACCLPWCLIASQRRKFLKNDLPYYPCCGGVCGPVVCSQCASSSYCCCFFWEVLCCMPCSVHGIRLVARRRYGLESTCWDRFVYGSTCFCLPLEDCCLDTWWPESICSCLYLFVLPCLLTQQYRELYKEEQQLRVMW